MRTPENLDTRNQNLHPIKAIRANCKECAGGGYKAVTDCQIGECSLYPLRFAKRPLGGGFPPAKAINAYCLYCMGARVVNGKPVGRNTAAKRARECHLTKCELHHIRYGEKKRGHWNEE